MSAYELGRDYPSSPILDTSQGDWVVPGVVKKLSSSEAILIIREESNDRCAFEFPSSQVCLIGFRIDNDPRHDWQTVCQYLSCISSYWIMVIRGKTATAIRKVSGTLSLAFDGQSQCSLTVAIKPGLSADEWRQLGMKHFAVVTINEADSRHVSSEKDVNELLEKLRAMQSFSLNVTRFEGGMLGVSSDGSKALLSYIDLKSGVKKASLNASCIDETIVLVRIEDLPDLEVETELRRLIPLHNALEILRRFLLSGDTPGLVAWPEDVADC